jgi:predicted RNA-binding protein YlxR (DUF448 family)
MHRIAATTGGWRVGLTEPGRGAWVCSVECFDRALRRSSLARALRSPAPTDGGAELRARLLG